MSIRGHITALSALFALSVPLTGACAQQGNLSFDDYLEVLSARARAEGVRETTIASMTSGEVPNLLR